MTHSVSLTKSDVGHYPSSPRPQFSTKRPCDSRVSVDLLYHLGIRPLHSFGLGDVGIASDARSERFARGQKPCPPHRPRRMRAVGDG
jgi:hypothetical protein